MIIRHLASPRAKSAIFAVSLLVLAACHQVDEKGVATAVDETSSASASLEKGNNAVSALGRLQPEHGILRLAAPSMPEAVSGAVLKTLLVEEGDDVKAGQILAITDTAELLKANVEAATAGLESARQQAALADSRATEACVRAALAKTISTRRTGLSGHGVISREDSDIAAGDADASAAACAASRSAVTAARAGIALASAQVRRNQVEFERAYIRAPIAARVLRILKRPGELIQADGVIELGQVTRMYAVAEVYETEVRRIRKGQKATVSSPALDGTLTGVVAHIRPKVQKLDELGTDPAARKDARIVEVEILLDQPEKAAALTNLQVEIVISG